MDGMDCGTLYRLDGAHAARVYLGGGRAMSVTIHDVAAATQARCQEMIRQIESAAPETGPFTLLVVPHYHHQPSTPAFERWIETRLRRGDELALHGLTHLDDAAPATSWTDHFRRRVYTAGEGEFAALDPAAARERLEAGRHWFAQRGWPLRGFVAPAWLLGAGAWSALCAQPLDYTCTLTRLIGLPAPGRAMRALHGWSIVFSTRAAWRCRMSLVWNAALARRQRHAQWMRFELHPADAEHTAIQRAIARLLARARAGGRKPMTLGAVVDRLE
jgi:hypothetical protein